MIKIDATVKYESEVRLELEIPEGITVLLGEAGSYKSTVLKVIGGVATIEDGVVVIDGRSVEQLPPWKRDTVLVSAETVPTCKKVKKALMQPWRLRGMSRADALERATEAAEKFGLNLGGRVTDNKRAFFEARMSLRNTEISMFDEPYHFFGEDVTEMIRSRKSKYVIVSSSDGGDVRRLHPDYLIVLRNGLVLQSEKPPKVSASPINKYVDLLVNM